MGNQGQLPEGALRQFEILRGSRELHLDLMRAVLEAGGHPVLLPDLVIHAALQRSTHLIDGFIALVEARNAFAAMPLIRLQLDSVLRIIACDLAREPQKVLIALLQGKELRRLKAREEGRQLNDAYLRSKLAEVFPWVDEVYELTSGYVHLSRPHMVYPVQSLSDEGTLSLLLRRDSRYWEDDQLVRAVRVFGEVTVTLFKVITAWRERKAVTEVTLPWEPSLAPPEAPF